MLILELYDSNGSKLNFGDIVRVSNGRIEFFAEVKYLENEQIITPFHTFSFHTFHKVDVLPEGLNKSGETRYNIWYNPLTNHENEDVKDSQYLMDWRQCEHLLEKRCYRIQKIDQALLELIDNNEDIPPIPEHLQNTDWINIIDKVKFKIVK